MLIQDLHPEAERLSASTAYKIVEYGERRLQKCKLAEFLPSESSPNACDIATLKIGKLLGKGSFSSAYEVIDTKRELAIKMLQPKLIQRPPFFAGCAVDLVREGMILRRLNHPNVIKCHAMGDLQSFKSGRHDSCVLVLEKLNITLKEQLSVWRRQAKHAHYHHSGRKLRVQDFLFKLSGGGRRRMQKTLAERTDMILQLAEAIRYLHANRILHRDLKPDNIGITTDGTLKVFDLDVCRIMPEDCKDPNYAFNFTRHVGSPRYMAPEVSRGGLYNAKADVYSFGLLCYELLSLKRIYDDIPSPMMSKRVVFEGIRPRIPHAWPKPVTSLIQRCWTEHLNIRPTMNQVLGELRYDLYTMFPSSEFEQECMALQKKRFMEESGRTQRSESTLDVSAAQ